jgi:hypothetical protein
MGNTSSQKATRNRKYMEDAEDTEDTENAINIEPYFRSIQSFRTLCRTCEESWNTDTIEDVLEYENAHISERKAILAGKRALDMASDDLYLQDAISEALEFREDHAQRLAKESVRHAMKLAVDAHAADMFQLLVESVRKQETWNHYRKEVQSRLKNYGARDFPEARMLLEAIDHSEDNFDEMVRSVLEDRLLVDPVSSGSKPTRLESTESWTAALRTVLQVRDLTKNHVQPTLESVDRRFAEE